MIWMMVARTVTVVFTASLERMVKLLLQTARQSARVTTYIIFAVYNKVVNYVGNIAAMVGVILIGKQ